MEALNNSNIKGAFKRNDFIVRGLEAESHLGYQEWHRTYDSEIVKWINQRLDTLTPQEFIEYLNSWYAQPEIKRRFGIVKFTYGG